MTVEASGSWNASSVSVSVSHLTILQSPNLQPLLPGQSVSNLSSVLLHVGSMCGRKTSMSTADLLASWTNGNGTPRFGRTMEDYYRMCSLGKVWARSEDEKNMGVHSPILFLFTGQLHIGKQSGCWSSHSPLLRDREFGRLGCVEVWTSRTLRLDGGSHGDCCIQWDGQRSPLPGLSHEKGPSSPNEPCLQLGRPGVCGMRKLVPHCDSGWVGEILCGSKSTIAIL